MTSGILSGRHAVVTGGGRGIGAAIAERLAAEGAWLTLTGRDEARVGARAEALPEAQGLACDVTDAHAVQETFRRARARFGPVAILVNNAGAAESAPFTRTDPGLWARMLDVNLTGVYLCTRAALPDMLEAGAGRIVNVASTAGLKGYPYVTAYCAAKHGVLGLTRALALEVAAKGITVNAVCPGYTDTDLVDEAAARIAERTGRTPEQARAGFAAVNPQQRLMRPDEVAAAVAWLCLPETEAMTGQAIAVAGGEVM